MEMPVKLIPIFLAVAALVGAIWPAVAASPEEEFRTGLSAFNRGDFASALQAWRPLAESNHARSQAGIGFMYHRGLGVKVDDQQAAGWLRHAAEQGPAEGQFMLRSLYFLRKAVPQSYTPAHGWCRPA